VTVGAPQLHFPPIVVAELVEAFLSFQQPGANTSQQLQ